MIAILSLKKENLARFIQEFDPYSVLPIDQLEILQSKVKIFTLEKGKSVYLPGYPSNQVYLIHSGSIRMVTLVEDGKEFTSSLYHPGETFGELGLAGETVRSETAISCERTVLIRFRSEDLKGLLEQNFLFTLHLMRLIGARRHESENRLLQLFYAPVHCRLAKLLIHIATKRVKNPSFFPVQLRLTHEILASLAGTTRETTTVILNRFEKQGVIRKTKGVIFINDLQSLRTLAQDRAWTPTSAGAVSQAV